MPIPVSLIIDQCNALLDAEDSDRYTFDEDYKLAINNTQKWLVSLFHRIYGSKFSEEALKELIKVGVFKASNYSRISITNNPNAPTIFWQYNIDAVAAVNVATGVAIVITGQKFIRGDVVTILGTTNYDGTWEIVGSFGNNIIIDATYVAEVFAGTEIVTLVHRVWSILSVYPEITTIPAVPPTLPADSDRSYFCGALDGATTEVAVDSFLKSATRLTIEEWVEKERNPLVPGSSLIANAELKEYAYLNLINYNPNRAYTAVSQIDVEIEISPDRANELIGIVYLIIPEDISLESDTIPFPESIFDLVINKVINFISIKEDDRVNLYEITEREIAEVVNILT